MKDTGDQRANRNKGIYNFALWACALCLFTFGCTRADTPPRSGAEVYQATCVKCHGTDGRGINDAFPPLVDSKRLAGAVDPVAELVLRGARGPVAANGEVYNSVMTPLSFLSDEEIASVINYVRATYVSVFDSVDARRVATIRKETMGQGIRDITELWPTE